MVKSKFTPWFGDVADLLINLSAGWFGAAFIVSSYESSRNLNLWILILDVGFGILFLLVAHFLRKEYKQYELS